MQLIRSAFQNQYSVERDAKEEFKLKADILSTFVRQARAAFPDAFKPRTLILLSYNAPISSISFPEMNLPLTNSRTAKRDLGWKRPATIR
jgi:hypothetical protein